MNEICTKDNKIRSEDLIIDLTKEIVLEFSDALHDNDLKSKDRDIIINKMEKMISKSCAKE